MRRPSDGTIEAEEAQLTRQEAARLRTENLKLRERVTALEAIVMDETDGTFELRHLRQQNALLKARIDDLEVKVPAEPVTIEEAAERR